MRNAKLAILCLLIAAAVISVLSVTGVIPDEELGEVALITLAVCVIMIAVSMAWRVVRGRTNAPDSTDKPVP
jgi:hypothetical protein